MITLRYTLAFVLLFVMAGFAPLPAAAQSPARVNDDQVEGILERLEREADRFRESLGDALSRSRFDDTRAEDYMNEVVHSFEAATDRLASRFSDSQTAARHATEVLERSALVDRFMRQYPLTPRAQADWAYVRGMLDELARAYNVAWTWAGPTPASRVNDEDVEDLLDRVEKHADNFRKSFDDAIGKGRFDDTRTGDEVNGYVKDFERAADRWQDNFGDRRTAAADASEVLRRAARIDAFMRRYPMTPRAESDWMALRGALDELARAYDVVWTW